MRRDLSRSQRTLPTCSCLWGIPVPRRRKRPAQPSSLSHNPQLLQACRATKVYMLRLLLVAQPNHTYHYGHGLSSLLEPLGLEPPPECETEEDGIALKSQFGRMRALLAELDVERSDEPDFQPVFAANLELLKQALGLTPTEAKIVGFAALLATEHGLQSCSGIIGELTQARFFSLVAAALGLSHEDLQQALAPGATLVTRGLVSCDAEGTNELGGWLVLRQAHLGRRMLEPHDSVVDLLSDVLRPAPPSRLSDAAFSYMDKDVRLAVGLLKAALRGDRTGVNVLLYGPPGTGKTELAGVLARAVSAPLFEVAIEDGLGQRLKGKDRLRTARLAQTLLADAPAVLLFDEAEDVFGSWIPRTGGKAYMNRLLEGAATPTVWITNADDAVDPAYARRFDLILHLDVPPHGKRLEILRALCPAGLGEQDLKRLADHAHLAPAVVERAASVVQVVAETGVVVDPQEAFWRSVNATLKLQQHAPIRRAGRGAPLSFDPAFVQATCDLPQVAARLQRHPDLRICLSGPPGTGKSEFGRWLAETTCRPLHARRASELLSKYVGDTEKNLARAFRRAESDQAILLLDEVDGFLQDRGTTMHGWEVTAVNELLTQMERFEGCLVATTNRFDALDPAALRRFDLKIRFDYLDPDRAWMLFQRFCEHAGLGVPDDDVEQGVRQLHQLAPGDFAVAARQLQLGTLSDARSLLQSLREEVALKPVQRRPVGFLANHVASRAS